MTKAQVNEPENVIATVPGDGGPSAVDSETLQTFHTEIDLIVKSAAYGVTERRMASEDTRYCRWEGQSPDGRKHQDAKNGEPVFPYEGASDGRIRIADQIINERVLVLTAAAMRGLANPGVRGVNFDQESFAANMRGLLRWVVKNELGSSLLRELTKLAQYQEGDSPAGGVLWITWKQELALRTETITLQDLLKILVQTFGADAQDVQALHEMFLDPERDDDTEELLTMLMPQIKPNRAKKIVQELRDNNGTAHFPMPYLRVNGPRWKALRLFEDIFFPANTTDFTSDARCVFVREWWNKAQVLEKKASGEWSEEFCDELLKHEGETGFPLIFNRPEGITGDFSGQTIRQSYNPEIYRGLYETITGFWKAANEDDVPGLYMLTFSKCVADIAATDRELCDYSHGNYPGIFFGREHLTQRLWDSRGVSEVVMTEQNSLKLLNDAYNDNVSLGTVPPITVPRRRGNLRLTIGPLKIIKVDRPGEVAWMPPPPMPAGNDRQQQMVQNRIDQYWGRIAADVPPLLTQLHQEGLVSSFLNNLTDALVMTLQLCQQYMDDDQVREITGDEGMQIVHSPEDIQGKFHLEISCDPRDLDINYIKTLADVINQLLAWDTLSTIQRDKLVQRIFMAIEPRLAQETLRPVQSAQQDEIADEMNNFAKIAAGVEPPMAAQGQNFPLRLQVLQQIMQKNPPAVQRMAPDAQKILQARFEQLQNQVQQQQNAVIGRQVGKPALGGPPLGQPGVPGSEPGQAPQGISGARLAQGAGN